MQLWGPRYSIYVVSRRDSALFSVGRMPTTAKGCERAMGIAEALRGYLDGARASDRAIAGALAIHSRGTPCRGRGFRRA